MNGALESLGRLRLQALALLLVVFVGGALAGAAFERARYHRPPGPPREGLSPEMREELRLTPEQGRRIDAILAESRARTDAVFDRFLPELRALTDSIRTEVRTVLSPEQQEIFDRMEPPLGPHPPEPRDRRGGRRGPPPPR